MATKFQDNESDILEGVYVGAISTVIAAAFYGLREQTVFKRLGSMPTFLFIGATSGLSSIVSNLLTDHQEPLAAAASSAGDVT